MSRGARGCLLECTSLVTACHSASGLLPGYSFTGPSRQKALRVSMENMRFSGNRIQKEPHKKKRMFIQTCSRAFLYSTQFTTTQQKRSSHLLQVMWRKKCLTDNRGMPQSLSTEVKAVPRSTGLLEVSFRSVTSKTLQQGPSGLLSVPFLILLTRPRVRSSTTKLPQLSYPHFWIKIYLCMCICACLHVFVCLCVYIPDASWDSIFPKCQVIQQKVNQLKGHLNSKTSSIISSQLAFLFAPFSRHGRSNFFDYFGLKLTPGSYGGAAEFILR